MWQSGLCGYGLTKIGTKNRILFHGEGKTGKSGRKTDAMEIHP